MWEDSKSNCGPVIAVAVWLSASSMNSLASHSVSQGSVQEGTGRGGAVRETTAQRRGAARPAHVDVVAISGGSAVAVLSGVVCTVHTRLGPRRC